MALFPLHLVLTSILRNCRRTLTRAFHVRSLMIILICFKYSQISTPTYSDWWAGISGKLFVHLWFHSLLPHRRTSQIVFWGNGHIEHPRVVTLDSAEHWNGTDIVPSFWCSLVGTLFAINFKGCRRESSPGYGAVSLFELWFRESLNLELRISPFSQNFLPQFFDHINIYIVPP